MTAIYTIGYGNRSIDDFIKLLKLYHIAFLIDIRSQPYSKSNPEYTYKRLEANLTDNGIRYVFMGDALGGRPADRTCYDENDKVLYDEIRTRPFYLAGIERLKTAWQQNIPIAVMCAELRPEECHRSKLIGMTLYDLQIEVAHINEKGKLKNHETIMNEQRAKSDKVSLNQPSLFSDEELRKA